MKIIDFTISILQLASDNYMLELQDFYSILKPYSNFSFCTNNRTLYENALNYSVIT